MFRLRPVHARLGDRADGSSRQMHGPGAPPHEGLRLHQRATHFARPSQAALESGVTAVHRMVVQGLLNRPTDPLLRRGHQFHRRA